MMSEHQSPDYVGGLMLCFMAGRFPPRESLHSLSFSIKQAAGGSEETFGLIKSAVSAYLAKRPSVTQD